MANNAFTEDFFDSIFNDMSDMESVFKSEPKKEEKPTEPKQEDPAKEASVEQEAPAEESAEEVPTVEEPETEAEPKPVEAQAVEDDTSAEEAKSETETAEAEVEIEATPEVEEKESEAEEAVTDGADEQPAADDASAGAEDEAVADAEVSVETDASSAEEAAPTEPAEPAVEVKVEKPKRKRRTKKEMQALRAKEAAEKAAAEEAKAEKSEKAEEAAPKAEAKAEAEPEPEVPINEDFVTSLIPVLGPKYAAFKQDVAERINKITIQPGMPPAVVRLMISQNNELEKKLLIEGQEYFEAYQSLTDKDTGLIDRTRRSAEERTEGNATAKRLAGIHAITHYVFPATGEKIDLLRYANALKQATGFVKNVKDYVKSTSIALSTMAKVAA